MSLNSNIKAVSIPSQQHRPFLPLMTPLARPLAQVPSIAAHETLCTPFILWFKISMRSWWGRVTTYITVIDSASSSCWPMNKRPLVIRVCTLQNVCTALPKCRPWWTRGSWVVLTQSYQLCPISFKCYTRFFPRSQLQSAQRPSLLSRGSIWHGVVIALSNWHLTARNACRGHWWRVKSWWAGVNKTQSDSFYVWGGVCT